YSPAGRMSVSREQEDVDRDVTALSTDEVDTSMEVSAVDSEIIEPEFDPVEVAERDFSRWLAEIATGTETDTMLRYAPTKSNSIDITHSKPSGLTQFLSARRTRLTTLLRDQRSEEHTSELQSRFDLVCRLLLEKTKI